MTLDLVTLAAAAKTFEPPAIYKRKRTATNPTANVDRFTTAGWVTEEAYRKLAIAAGAQLKQGQRAFDPMLPVREDTTANRARQPMTVRKAVAALEMFKTSTKKRMVRQGVTASSRFVGVHLTLPSNRYEAQFRCFGRPLSLGTFKTEEQAVCAYDIMMVWLRINNMNIHAIYANRLGCTNFPAKSYAKHVPKLLDMKLDDVVESLRASGRKNKPFLL
jgi:hypothetical protein